VLVALGVGAAGDDLAVVVDRPVGHQQRMTAGVGDHVPAAVDRGHLDHGGHAEGDETGHCAGGPAERVVLREPAGVPAARGKNTLSSYEPPTTSPLALIPKPRLTPSLRPSWPVHGTGGLGRCRRGWRDGDQAGDILAED